MLPSASEATDEQSSAVNGHDASIRPLCLELAARVNAFLESERDAYIEGRPGTDQSFFERD